MKCSRILEREPGQPNKLCPNPADDEITLVVNGVPYDVLMCGFHVAEQRRKAGEARRRRREQRPERTARRRG